MYRLFGIFAFLTLPLFAAGVVEETVAQLKNLDISLKILFLITILSLAPAILITVTSFTRIVIVLSLLRHALGIPQSPPNQVIIALALFLTFFIMKPVFIDINTQAIEPYMQKKIDDKTALDLAIKPVKKFLLQNTQKKDIQLFLNITKERVTKPEDISLTTLIPAFLVSEIKIAFEVAFVIFLPFLVIDLLVASILMSMGMMMIPPMMISLPFKLILFILSDGWELLIKALIESYK
ncbi:flagellar biosynthetic protein FliP [Nitratiruptor sp. YY08-26]|uniref:flagellar type III secretion system pore protein FliP n=1 Tax=unclassified Nitratiruptor TaxID=2624044 RepID=UPI001915F301|nr:MULTISPECIES: flagellar type III secretion system pore protein FliP [unclassified Nitratiruptor]BCD61871.1 flagellar biosynthetic protein FliP [Nitratiruptor sp. YY08-13]BCD65806.1 flagellar biosynthetic protein FliP [Nitratiruptor sp. YY08-26]